MECFKKAEKLCAADRRKARKPGFVIRIKNNPSRDQHGEYVNDPSRIPLPYHDKILDISEMNSNWYGHRMFTSDKKEAKKYLTKRGARKLADKIQKVYPQADIVIESC